MGAMIKTNGRRGKWMLKYFLPYLSPGECVVCGTLPGQPHRDLPKQIVVAPFVEPKLPPRLRQWADWLAQWRGEEKKEGAC